jgi:ELWxxDGT repeat protein
MTAHNGFVFFSAVTPALGEELYVTDGVTVDLVEDINTGSVDGVRGGDFEDEYDATILSDGVRLYFTATTAAHGTEPWMLDAFADSPAPTSVAAIAGDATATVSWTAPDATPSGPITGYTVTSSPHGATCTTTGATTCTVTGLTNGTPYTFTVVASTAHGVSQPSDPSPAVKPMAPRFIPLPPARLLETRSGFSTIDGQHNDTGIRPAGTTYELDVTGRAGVPTDATAASLNVTAVFPQAPGYLTVYACGTPLPDASNINYFPGDIAPNAVLTPIGTNGKVCIHTLATTHILVDINGAFGP